MLNLVTKLFILLFVKSQTSPQIKACLRNQVGEIEELLKDEFTQIVSQIEIMAL